MRSTPIRISAVAAQKLRRSALRALLLAYTGVDPSIASAVADAPPISRQVTERVTAVVSEYMASHRVPGLAIAIINGGSPVWAGGFGRLDLNTRAPVTTTSEFRTGSIGKTMTATAAMQLVEGCKLDLDADIRVYCPSFPEKSFSVSSRQLLTHTSGIRHYGGPRDKEEQSSTIHYHGVADALKPFKDDPLLFEPGTRFSYSTYGYDVLGCVIEGAAGVPFLEYMRTNVWAVAGMAATRDDDPTTVIPNRAVGYRLVAGKVTPAPPVDMSNRMPAGGYLTTIADLARFVEAEMGGELVTASTFAQMITPGRLPDGRQFPYGLGWGMELESWHDDTWVYHGGSTPGFSGFVALMPRHRFAVMFMTNLEDLPERNELAEHIARIVLGFATPP